MQSFVSAGITRRHFLSHLAASAAALPALEFLTHLQAHASEVTSNQRACILMWMGGGPPTIDIWDMKPGTKTGGEFQPISTAADYQITEHLPRTAKIADSLSIVRSMSTREADHNRGRYFMHTAFAPNPSVVHPTFGSVVSHELGPQRPDLAIPAFVSIGGGSGSAGFLGMTHAPFVVGSDGQIRNAQASDTSLSRLKQRLSMLNVVESEFIESKRGDFPQAHRDVYRKAVDMMTTSQRRAFNVDEEPAELREMYGNDRFGRSLLMARRLVESGVPFVEVDLGGWDLHQNVFQGLRDRLLPNLDRGLSAIVADLRQRGLLDRTVLVWMGEFGRTPRINQNVGRDHWARSWSTVLGGGGLKAGQAVGATDADGTAVVGKSYSPGDVWATVAHALGIPLERVYKSKSGRPMKLANGGMPIAELIG